VIHPFARTYALTGGPTVRLRLARRSDTAAVARFLTSRDFEASELEIARLLTFDPARRAVLCAFAPLDGRDELVGLGAIELAPDAEPDALVVDERLTPGLGRLLLDLLRDRADTRLAG
jgi:hypothetical protein